MVAVSKSVIEEEIRWQLKKRPGLKLPDYVIACGRWQQCGRTFYHFLDEASVSLPVAVGQPDLVSTAA